MFGDLTLCAVNGETGTTKNMRFKRFATVHTHVGRKKSVHDGDAFASQCHIELPVAYSVYVVPEVLPSAPAP